MTFPVAQSSLARRMPKQSIRIMSVSTFKRLEDRQQNLFGGAFASPQNVLLSADCNRTQRLSANIDAQVQLLP